VAFVIRYSLCNQRSWDTSPRVRASFRNLRTDRLSFRAFSTDMQPSVRSSGRSIAPDSSCLEYSSLPDMAVVAITGTVSNSEKFHFLLFYIPPIVIVDIFRTRQRLADLCVHLIDLLHYYRTVPQMVNHYPVTSIQIQPIPYGRRKQNPAVSIDLGNHSIIPSISLRIKLLDR